MILEALELEVEQYVQAIRDLCDEQVHALVVRTCTGAQRQCGMSHHELYTGFGPCTYLCQARVAPRLSLAGEAMRCTFSTIIACSTERHRFSSVHLWWGVLLWINLTTTLI
jgi:hypothetical protein